MNSPHPRVTFWETAEKILTGDTPWSERCLAMNALVAEYDNGQALIDAGGRPDCESTTGVAPPLPPEQSGYRAFVKHWEAGESTGCHGHPDTMYVYLISTRLKSEGFRLESETPVPDQTITRGPGETFTGHVPNGRFDNFIHRLHAETTGWSLHIYSDLSDRGVRFELEDSA